MQLTALLPSALVLLLCCAAVCGLSRRRTRRKRNLILLRSQVQSQPFVGDALLWQQPQNIRSTFISKVYGILAAQLVLTFIVASPFVLSTIVKDAATRNPGILKFCALLNVVFMFMMVCPCGCRQNLRTFPLNYCLLAGFTVTEGVLVGCICSQYTLASVAFAVIATGILMFGLSVYARTTKSDFTAMRDVIFVMLFVVFVFGIFCIFVRLPLMEKVYCCLGILVFSIYIIFDTQLLLGNKELALTIDDYIFASLQLYVDVIQLFLYILKLFGEKKK